ncbi:succinate dehydrogenase / fumarate reductase membrane anchor subunit [Luteimonas cucumeris]|uniref:Succinate dehydrogenase hydrophobic membrane anchor subunit n=1 Tax=Luteimonas cucumeris TaxID=985012 RepID=A0A562LAB8_9GAMM|nr:succinate dehydrogenase, hydrophobic membrane anchor protein [Luteimonas cucumeris]TWI04505.1 succinate dehydrogenase / fumarate reductase membrane anchor subunit [Luteimonas cucumeris]
MSGSRQQEVRARDLRTPIARARGLGSAKSGTDHFWWQRVTAIALAVLVPWLVYLLVSLVGADLDAARAMIARPWNAILLAVFMLALFWHAKLGLQVVIEDYVHTRTLEVASQLLVTLACVVGAFASLYAIGRIALMA